jgi:hypothetical protein
MKAKFWIYFIPLLLIGCVGMDDKKQGYCLDYRKAPVEVEDCTPLYGSIICVTKIEIRYWCSLWSEEAKRKKEKRNG